MHPNVSGDGPVETQGHTLPMVAPFYDIVTGILALGRERKFREAILDRAGVAPGQRVLDVGCGTGTLALLAKERVGAADEVVGLDATPQMIARARRKASRRGLDVHFDVGVIEKLPYRDASFDVALNSLMMHHLPGDLKQKGLAEVRRILKPGGRLLIVDIGEGGHSLATLVHGEEAVAAGSALSQLVQQAGFVEVENGRTGMRGMVYVKGSKPA